jgi:hypothetical protein
MRVLCQSGALPYFQAVAAPCCSLIQLAKVHMAERRGCSASICTAGVKVFGQA